MRWFILGLLGVVVLSAFAAIRMSLMSLRRLPEGDEADESGGEVKLLPPPQDDPQAPGHPDAANANESEPTVRD